MVLANGTIVTASAAENSDLFWAARGCGSAFGVATEFVYQGHPQGDVWSGLLIFAPDKLSSIVEIANHFHAVNNSDQSFAFGFSSPLPHNQAVILCVPFYNGPAAEAELFFAELLALGPLVNGAGTLPYSKMNSVINDAVAYGGRKTSGGSAVKLPLDKNFVQSVFDDFVGFIQGNEGMGESAILFELIPYGKVMEVPLENTAYGNRGEYYNVGTVMKWYDPSLDMMVRAYARSLHSKITEGGGTVGEEGTGAYANYIGESSAYEVDAHPSVRETTNFLQIIHPPPRKYLVRTGKG